MAESSEKPAVLIVGGLGYIGRFLALYIHKNHLASEVRLVDKVLPQLAWLAPEFAEACSRDKFMQADAGREQSLAKIFTPLHAQNYTYVFNCGGETRYSQDDSVYALRSTALTATLGAECARRRIPAYVEFGTGKVYKPPPSSVIANGGCTETAPIKPWLKLADHKLAAEQALETIHQDGAPTSPGTKGVLSYVILRIPHVYGDYDQGFLARGLCLARVYQEKGEALKWLYGKDLRIGTVHVDDCVRAAWLAAGWCRANPSSSQTTDRIFNVIDEGDTRQVDLATIIAHLFSMDTGFQNALISAFAKLNIESVVDDINEGVLQPWADLLAAKSIVRAGPIGPWMEKELLKDCDLCLDGTRAKRILGFEVDRKKLTEDGVRSVVESYKRMGWWP